MSGGFGSNPWGNTNNNANQSFGGGSNPFGSSTPLNPTAAPFAPHNTGHTFGTPSAPPPSHPGAPSSSPFGGTPSTTPFGAQAPSTVSGAPPSTPFPNQFGASNVPSVPFPSSNPFGSSTAPPPSSNPFGNDAPAMTFGVSSSIVPATPTTFANSTVTTNGFGSMPQGAVGGGNSSNPFGGTNNRTSGFGNNSSGFGTSTANGSAPFGSSSNTGGPFGANHTQNSGFGNSTGSATVAPPSNPFSSSNNQRNNNITMTFGAAATEGDADMGGSPVPSQSNSPMSGSPVPQQEKPKFTPFGKPLDEKEKDDQAVHLADLTAKIEAKKKKLADRKAKEAAAAKNKDGATTVTAAPVRESSSKKSLAQRNALRFGSNTTATSTTRQSTAASPTPVRSQERSDLDTAVNLVGTCQNMCPDEELQRREAESDIQLLERPHNNLHPSSWTIRDTAVKRFRRSAADFKLDVPEWVRPPHVLERVCAYLEEWVMERDRQGPDPRLPGSTVPASLDVYQFIWDRTRMIRKDFILQNYVGTGGQCNASAVRCHERIARWHAMCEHQLSHLTEYQQHQSQQNIQELGQTMKTLNQYYDDSLHRSTVEAPDENGAETLKDLTNIKHGCEHDTVQGSGPVDYNEKLLLNDTSGLDQRVIGFVANHGTSEAEMRGMYILLTIDNDGGMEVLKYAGQLFTERREMYESPQVQLAMNVYKAKRELNYARFFSLLRSPSTPYLYSCIMFKHVKFMRETAFRIMSKTFGGLSKETKEGVYDQYPLKELVRLLCFEDVDEARDACKHYGIVVKEMRIKGSSKTTTAEIVFWKKQPFRIPKDPEKGTVKTLSPRKMMRTIEYKVRGATRLGICRGQVSNTMAATQTSSSTMIQTQGKAVAALEAIKQQEERRRQEEVRQSEEEDRARASREAEKTKQAEEEAQRQAEKQEQDAAAKAEIERQKQMQLALLEEENRRKAKEELLRRKKEEEETRRKLEEEERKRREEEQRLQEIARQEKRRREEATRRKLEEEQEQRKKEAERLAQIKALQLKLAQEETARKLAVERRVHEVLRQKEHKAALEAAQLAEQIASAKKKLLLLRWNSRLPVSVVVSNQVQKSIRCVSPSTSISRSVYETTIRSQRKVNARTTQNVRMSIETILKRGVSQPDIADFVAKVITANMHQLRPVGHDKACWLIKVGLILPNSRDLHVRAYSNLLERWFDTAFAIERQHTASRGSTEVRICFTWDLSTSCDAVVIALPPLSTSLQIDDSDLHRVSSQVKPDTPRVVLALTDEFETSSIDVNNSRLASHLAGSFRKVTVVNNTGTSERSLQDALHLLCHRLAESIAEAPLKIITRIPAGDFVCDCVTSILDLHPEVAQEAEVAALAETTVYVLIDELVKRESLSTTEMWPDPRFTHDSWVPRYYSDGGLPCNWFSLSSGIHVVEALSKFLDKLSSHLTTSIETIVQNAPESVQLECSRLLAYRRYSEGMKTALRWKKGYLEPWEEDQFLYFKQGEIERILAFVGSKVNEEVLEQRKPVFTPIYVELTDLTLKPRPTQAPKCQDIEDQEESLSFIDRTPKRSLDDEPPAPIDSVHKPGEHQPLGISPTPKRQRRDRDTIVSRSIAESMDFTAQLEALASGDVGADMIVGNTTLSSILRNAESKASSNPGSNFIGRSV